MEQRGFARQCDPLSAGDGVGANGGGGALERPWPVMHLNAFKTVTGPGCIETVPFGEEVLNRTAARFEDGPVWPVGRVEHDGQPRSTAARLIVNALAFDARGHR